MGLLDIFRSKKRTSPPPSETIPPAHGWDAITTTFAALYPGQDAPAHRAPLVHRMHDLSEHPAAFDGISAYDAGSSWHFVTYGLTELYAKEQDDAEVSGFGYELTFRVPKLADTPPAWAFDFLEAIGKSVWSGTALGPGHTIKTGPLDGRTDTPEVAVLVVRDPAVPEPVATPNGRVTFLLLLGVDDACRQRVLAAHAETTSDGWEAAIVNELRASNPDLVTPIRTQGPWGTP
ncbi:MAG: suppressor of fused domain protein [Kofleriaceae bacterium]|nr:suppressor of fused domain protein [Kofleriaceae bacterium]